MTTEVITERPLMTLESYCYNGHGESVDIYHADLQKAVIDDEFQATYTLCGRGMHCETLKIVYKDENGCAGLIREFGTKDTPDAEEWEHSAELVWFELKGGK